MTIHRAFPLSKQSFVTKKIVAYQRVGRYIRYIR